MIFFKQMKHYIHSVLFKNMFFLHGSMSYIPNIEMQIQEKSSVFGMDFFKLSSHNNE